MAYAVRKGVESVGYPDQVAGPVFLSPNEWSDSLQFGENPDILKAREPVEGQELAHCCPVS